MGLTMLSSNESDFLTNKRVLITGGTGSLGHVIARKLIAGEWGAPRQIVIFSRDEAKQHYMRLEFRNTLIATDEVIYQNFKDRLRFFIGDVRNTDSLRVAMRDIDVVINAAALKQVPTCEYFPFEAVQTNVHGAQNIVRTAAESGSSVECVVGISTDKACEPINVMGMTKSLMERIFIEANISVPNVRFVCVRYGNVIASRGSVVPLFLQQIAAGGPVTVTSSEMTRFLMPLDAAAETVWAALRWARPGEIFVPRIGSARIIDLAAALIDDRDIRVTLTGVRPGEKLHEVMVSQAEATRTVARRGYYVILPMLPELERAASEGPALNEAYSSARVTLTKADLLALAAGAVAAREPALEVA
jgi:FlaA1/EpsC-like NDP-sugar epimerase